MAYARPRALLVVDVTVSVGIWDPRDNSNEEFHPLPAHSIVVGRA